MNIVLLEPGEIGAPLPRADQRAQHILGVLRRSIGESFVAGLVNGPVGTATLAAATATSITLSFVATHEPPPPPSIVLLAGLPRPQTARDLLRDATTLGVSRIHFVATERADPNYAASVLWTTGEWRRRVLAGAAQACDTRLPEVTWTHTLASALAREASAKQTRLALDNYEATIPLADALAVRFENRESESVNSAAPLVLALGPERGWGPTDRDQLRAAGFTLCSLGQRVLRLETAVIAALALAHHARV